MRVNCPHCQARAVILSRQNQSETAADLYCRCPSLDCPSGGATIVYRLGYSHTILQPTRSAADLALAVLRDLSPQELARLRPDLAAVLNPPA